MTTDLSTASTPTLQSNETNSNSTEIIEGLFGRKLSSKREMEESEISGYDEVGLLQMELHDNYDTLDVHYLATDKGQVCAMYAISPLGFKCYIINACDRKSSVTLESISPFIPREYHNSIITKCGHKASGVAIRHGNKISFNWEDNSYNCRSPTSYSSPEDILPIITGTQLRKYPRESLIMMYEQYRAVRSDQALYSMNQMDIIMERIHFMKTEYYDICDRSYDILESLKKVINPLVAETGRTVRVGDLDDIIHYREQILDTLSSISKKSKLIEELEKDYCHLNQLLKEKITIPIIHNHLR